MIRALVPLIFSVHVQLFSSDSSSNSGRAQSPMISGHGFCGSRLYGAHSLWYSVPPIASSLWWPHFGDVPVRCAWALVVTEREAAQDRIFDRRNDGLVFVLVLTFPLLLTPLALCHLRSPWLPAGSIRRSRGWRTATRRPGRMLYAGTPDRRGRGGRVRGGIRATCVSPRGPSVAAR